MGKIARPLIVVGLWMLIVMQGKVSPAHIERTTNDYGQARTVYIVHMDQSPTDGVSTPEAALSRYTQLLQTLKPASTLDSKSESAILPLHVYSSVCHGFSAHLTSEEAEALKHVNGVLAVYPDTMVPLLTTRTPEFLGLTTSLRNLWLDGDLKEDVIIGMIDTGVWPESESFSDEGLGPVPARWKGICESGEDFNATHCNNKMIGARYYFFGMEKHMSSVAPSKKPGKGVILSPRDDDGHGTHTASTAAGSMVPNANLFGSANGTARGMAPKARIAMYKVCWQFTNGEMCLMSDILKAIDDSVADGVDIISMSLGGYALPYTKDMLSIGTFGAMNKGVFVSCAAGNNGPNLQTVTNVSPWMMTVAAGTVDRAFPANLELGNGKIIPGQSMYQLKDGVADNAVQLITGADAALNDTSKATLCLSGSLDPSLAKGRIVVCARGTNGRIEKGAEVLAAGGAGMVLYNTDVWGEDTVADPHFLPATHVGPKAGVALLAYMSGTPNPVGKFQFLGTQLGVTPAPAVAIFSSRGPNSVTPEVLKPDISAPGVNILAAWSPNLSITRVRSDPRFVDFNIISGTSMATPHITGLAALLKAAHPDWSPAAIKSAMMTTASRIDNTGGKMVDSATMAEATPFEYGAGQVQPEKALDPGLVYDMGPQDYVDFLCAVNVTGEDLKLFTSYNKKLSCPKKSVGVENLNYPSFSAVFKERPSRSHISMKMKRTLTNVGSAKSTYSSQVIAPSDVKITITPSVLKFHTKNQKKKFTVKVKTVNTPDSSLTNTTVTSFAYLVWTNGVHVVQSPIAISLHK
ncbi:hypothetical protein KC19_8G155000 [Ceratodon purpureus]|uniref:Subtilisin-like protease n=1 Tax=Ceratodon purpureus TaxID=3225 RepID=A0A8T0H7D8_CERPU|nr:hypothetical protein KC19_8G155000 [Ceratodon purpureus]